MLMPLGMELQMTMHFVQSSIFNFLIGQLCENTYLVPEAYTQKLPLLYFIKRSVCFPVASCRLLTSCYADRKPQGMHFWGAAITATFLFLMNIL